MADAAGPVGGGSRKRQRETQGHVVDLLSDSTASNRFKGIMAKRRLRRGGARGRVARRRTVGRRRSARAFARRTAATYVPPKTNVSSTGHRGQQLVERVPVHIQRSLNPFPPMWKGHLTYGVDVVPASPGSVNYWTVNVFGMNDMYDPQVALGGHQPFQYDSLTGANGPYTQVQVLGFSYSLRFNDPTTDGLVVGVFWRGYGDALGNPQGQSIAYMMEKGRCDIQTLSNSGSQNCDFSGYVDLPSLVGLTPDQYMGQLEYGHIWNASPAKRLDFYVAMADPNGKVDPQYCRCIGWVRYHAVFSGAVSLPAS